MTPDPIIRPATPADIPAIQSIAQATWPIAYKEILSPTQLAYMLNLFYSTTSLQTQFNDGQIFFIAESNSTPTGFASITITNQTSKLQKLYIHPKTQGKGIGEKLLAVAIESAKSKNAITLILNVNRNNRAIDFYKKHGFQIIGKEDVPIGENYYMNDYVMQLNPTSFYLK